MSTCRLPGSPCRTLVDRPCWRRIWNGALLGTAGLLVGCRDAPAPETGSSNDAAECVANFDAGADYYPNKAAVRHADNFRITYHGHYKVLRTQLRATSWGPAISHVLVLNKCGTPVPPLDGELAGATVIETPVRRFATNSLSSALQLRVLGLDDRIVAMPANPYDPDLAERVRAGRVVPTSVHGEPHLEGMRLLSVDALVVFASSLDHAGGLPRARELGVPTTPLLSWAEPTSLGRAEWIKHHAALFDAEAEAESFFTEVESRYHELAGLVAGREPVPALWATPMGRGEWWVEAGTWLDEVMTTAGGRNVFTARPDESPVVGAERIAAVGDEARVWITDDPDPLTLDPGVPLREIAAWRAGRAWHVQGRSDAARDAYDWNETPLVRPDLVLADLISVLHPGVIPGHEFRFLEALPDASGGEGGP